MTTTTTDGFCDTEPTITYHVGDVFQVMADMPDGSVDLILTSPPFLAVRSYLPDDHPDKDLEIGQEPDPAAFVDTLLRLAAEWRRILAPHGSLVVELGDTYAGSGGPGGNVITGGSRDGQPRWKSPARRRSSDLRGNHDGMRDTTFSGPNTRTGGGAGWPLAKSLSLVPELFRIALAYGHHPLTGCESPAGRWRVRNVVRWVRPNPPVGALGDKFRPATTDIVVACVSADRWFDLDAVRTPPRSDPSRPAMHSRKARQTDDGEVLASARGSGKFHPAGVPPLDWWEIPPGGYDGAHYAVWPPRLLTVPIESMCPRRVCRTCGEPSRRIVDRERVAEPVRPVGQKNHPASNPRSGFLDPPPVDWRYHRETVGWSDCGHDDWRPGIVLDPFAGTGTTLAVAHGHGRSAVGIDIDERNQDMARDRIGPLFFH